MECRQETQIGNRYSKDLMCGVQLQDATMPVLPVYIVPFMQVKS
jgi:hypothetical protein